MLKKLGHFVTILDLQTLLVTLLSASCWAGEDGEVLDPTTKHYGKTYSELAGDWWNWAVQFPLATSPFSEEGEVDCSRGQNGKIWFLAGSGGSLAAVAVATV